MRRAKPQSSPAFYSASPNYILEPNLNQTCLFRKKGRPILVAQRVPPAEVTMTLQTATVSPKWLGLIAAAFVFAMPIMAQQGPRPPGDVDPARARFEDTSKREMQLRGLGNMPKKPADPKQLQALMAQVQEDFERILTLHNQIARAITKDQTLAVDFVSDATAEIRKRATRLQATLA